MAVAAMLFAVAGACAGFLRFKLYLAQAILFLTVPLDGDVFISLHI